MKRKIKKERVVVAMSGGVDSSLAAALLLEDGYDVIGVTMRLSDISHSAGSDTKEGSATTHADDARHVADVLGIRHHVLDFTELFERFVMDYFFSEYLHGRTPNPCVACNRHIKFGELLNKAKEFGASYVATGHYARIDHDVTGTYHLRKGVDSEKDQSYVLYHLNQQMLAHILLPIGELNKAKTRCMAERYHLPVAHKAESQEICFVPDDDYKSYMMQKRPESSAPGNIVDRAGNILGVHKGVAFYTIGQRRGLGIASSHPLYVIGLDPIRNHVIVGKAEDVFARELMASGLSWITGATPDCHAVQAKIRYGKREARAWIIPEQEEKLRVRFEEPQRAVTPGQSVVFYDGDIVLGGGTIDKVML